MAKGDALDVLLTGKEPLENVPRTARENGLEVLSVVATNADSYHVVSVCPKTLENGRHPD